MAIIRWNPFEEVGELQRRMNRLFDDYTVSRRGEEEFSSAWAPRVDIFEDENAILLSAELPGMEQKDIQVNVENGVLTLAGERKLEKEEKKDKYTRVERYYGGFRRSFSLPNTVDQEKIEAHMDKGVLKISMPRREETKPKQIQVKVK